MNDAPPGNAEGLGVPQAVLDRISDGFFAMDDDWKFTYLNERGREIVGAAMDRDVSVDELVGRNIWEAVPEAVGTVFHEQYRRAMSEQERVDFEAYCESAEEWFSVRAYPSESGLSVYVQTITDGRGRDERLAEREQVLQDVHEAMSDDRPFEEKVESLLRIGRQVLGLDYGTLSRIDGEEYVFEVVSARDDAIEAGDTLDLSATNCERTAATEQAVVLADVATDAPELTDRAGFTEWGISCYLGTPIYADGAVYGTFCFYDTSARTEPFTDWEVTLVNLLGKLVSYGLDQERAERELERKNERLEEFALTVSHDLRNPLAVALGNVSLAQDDPEAGSLDDVAMALERMDAIISDLLDVARESGAADVEPVEIGALGRDCWNHLDSPGTLRVDGEVHIDADDGSLERLLENLFQNAVEHGTHESGDPDDGPTMTIGALSDGFYVEDDGPGIPDAERTRVFDSGYTSNEDGTGFGLSIVERIADAHGWTVTVTESESGGARFEFSTAGRDATPETII